ncbi:MAG: outer membrane protein assembly factor BamA [Simkaniaceae bacterium]
MKNFFLRAAAPILLTINALNGQYSSLAQYESYENRNVGKICIQLETCELGCHFDQSTLINRLSTKQGDPFSQAAFDQDLKMLSEEYDRVDPTIEVRHGEIVISIRLWEKPLIQDIKWYGNHKVSSGKLQRLLGIKPGSEFDRSDFNRAFNKIKEYYVKQGFFEAELQYTILPNQDRNEVNINVVICEGRSGRISGLNFKGFSKEEQSHILNMIVTKRYNLFMSWLTGTGTYKEEALEHDKLMIVNYLQNQGYADAAIDIEISESEKTNRIEITVVAEKGEIYEFGTISFSGNDLFSEEEVEKVLLIKNGDKYSPERVRDSMNALQRLYGSKGYIEANVSYRLNLDPFRPRYDVHFDIEEGEKYYIGLVRVLGNVSTNTHVILRESLLNPGEIFDSRRLEATQRRLEAMGFFKSVNVYTVLSSDDEALGPNYRDVNIEVEETTTGNISLFVGASTSDSIFGGLDLTENNFNIRGMSSVWRDGASAIRGNGEYFHTRLSYGAKQQNYIISWLNPYFNDSKWRVGFDLSYQHSTLQSSNYDIDTYGFSLYANYPISNYWTFGTKYRFKNASIDIEKIEESERKQQERNSGIVTGFGLSLGYDSVDNPFKPHRGLRSSAETEMLYEHRRAENHENFLFMKMNSINTYYYPVWRLGTLKVRGEARFIYPMGAGKQDEIPLSELYFLGGDTTVRGYKPFTIGSHFKKEDGKAGKDDPTGGLSSVLASVEYNQQIVPVLDTFAFFDGGSVSRKEFAAGKFVMSYGGGIRLQVGGRVPLTVGVGFPINPERSSDKKVFFFSMGGQF